MFEVCFPVRDERQDDECFFFRCVNGVFLVRARERHTTTRDEWRSSVV